MTRSVSTVVAARVGYSGEKVHEVVVSVQRQSLKHPRTPGALAVYWGNVQCGSRRGLSGYRVTGLDRSTVTCQRCLAFPMPGDRVYGEGTEREDRYVLDASAIVTTDRRGTLVPVEPFPFDIDEATR